MKKYFQVTAQTDAGQIRCFIQSGCTGEASKTIKSDLVTKGLKVDSIDAQPVEYTESMFKKSWQIEDLGTIVAVKQIVDGEHAVKLSVESDIINKVAGDFHLTLSLQENGADVAQSWNDFDIEDALEFATVIYDKVHSKMIRAPLEDKPDIIH